MLYAWTERMFVINIADDYESPDAEDSFPAGRYDDDSADDGTFADYYDDEPYQPSEAQLKRYMDLLRAVDELKALDGPTYVPVIYRGVKGVFVPETSIAKKYPGGLYQTSLPFSRDAVQSAADKWSTLVREKALDEYDLVYRLADALQKHKV